MIPAAAAPENVQEIRVSAEITTPGGKSTVPQRHGIAGHATGRTLFAR